VNKRKIKRWLLEWTGHLCIVAITLFLFHAYKTWGSRLALIGFVLITAILIALAFWGNYRAHMKMEYDEEIETTDSTKHK
jgi:hypothetical protein